MHRLFINILLASMLMTSPAISAENLTPISEKLYYEADWSGVNFGKIGIEIDQQANKADVTCDIRSSGIMALFVKHSSHTTLTATGNNYVYPDRTYESRYFTRKKARHVKLTYEDNKISEQIVEPPDNRDKRPAVPEDDINSAYDLMSFLLQMRSEITLAQKSGKMEFSINSYDGRRLTQGDFKILGKKTIKIAGKKHETLMINARRKLLAGYTKSEEDDYNPKEPSMTIYFSNDEKLLPLRMEIPFFMQNVSATLIKRCEKAGECLL
ncbi:MAG: DUF3108 domain-containing protein [Pseudomonadota bacterium]|mgnify:CR=1 FL=1